MPLMNKPLLPPIELPPSRRLAVVLGGAHGAVLLLLVLLPVAWWIVLPGGLLLAASAVMTIRQHALRRGANAVTALAFADRSQLRLRMGDGAWREGKIRGSSTVGAGFAVLNIELKGKGSASVVLLGDGIAEEDFRRLRVWLRWGPQPAGSDAGLA
jgi:hypothetical protein